MIKRSFVFVVISFCAFASGSGSWATAETVLPELTKENYSAWRDQILPAKSDLGWQQIPWLTTFQAGILDADQRTLPLLFWTMNGHPLGCT